jgi:A/G-specific adenine glycosylase
MRAQGKPVSSESLRSLVDWFRRSQRVLPWREDPSLYRVWISEIMLQQTQVATVKPYFERFMAAFPTVEALAAAPEDAVMKEWEGLGYYSRARNLHRAAKAIVERGGTANGFPRTREDWLEIPGVGPYTAGAITSIALGLPEPIVDGNVERVLARVRMLGRSGGEGAYKSALWELSGDAVVRAHGEGLSPSELNQGWMELGATICTPKKPACLVCPIAADCRARAEGMQEEFPERKKPKEWIAVREKRVALLDLENGKVWLERTVAGKWREGMWDFPERLPKAFERKSLRPLGVLETKHVVTRHKIDRRTEVFSVPRELIVPDGCVASSEDARWVAVRAPEVAMGSAPKKGLLAILERFRG